jgi:hypothetical protein
MTDAYKKLAAIAPTNDDEKFLYAAPAATSSLVSNITVANRSASATTFDINIYQSGITQQSDIDNSDVGKNFYIVSESGGSYGDAGIQRSTDGITWTKAAGTANNNHRPKVVFGNGVYLAGYNNGGVSISTNGITWAIATGTTTLLQEIKSAAFGAGVFIFTASDSRSEVSVSTNGISWTSKTLPIAANWDNVIYAQDKFVAIAGYTGTAAATSTNGTTWTQRTLPATFGNIRTKVAYGNNSFVVVRPSNLVAHSTDAITWTTQTLPVTFEGTRNAGPSVAYGNGVFAAISYGTAAAASSTNGITWTGRTLPITEYARDVVYGAGKFITVAYGRSTGFQSTDGATWTTLAVPTGKFNHIDFIGPYISPNINKLYSSSAVGANQTVVLEPGITLPASASIVVKDRSSGNLTFSTYGVELS